MNHSRLVIILDHPNPLEKKMGKPLGHDGGQLLVWMTKKLSIPRESWVHTYAYDGNSKEIPTTYPDTLDRRTGEVVKMGRKNFMAPHLDRLLRFVSIQPCSVVGMGKLITELTTESSTLKEKAGTYWIPRKVWLKCGIKRVWLTYGPDAALFNPELVVGMCRVIGKAAQEVGIDVRLNNEIQLYNWSKYL